MNYYAKYIKYKKKYLKLVKDLEVFTGIDSSSFENYFVKEMRREMRKKSINKIFQNLLIEKDITEKIEEDNLKKYA